MQQAMTMIISLLYRGNIFALSLANLCFIETFSLLKATRQIEAPLDHRR